MSTNPHYYRLIEELYKYGNNDNMEEAQKLLEPFTYLLKNSSEGIRSNYPVAFNHWLKIPEDKFQEISDAIYLFHIATLLIDDIQDNSVLRQGFPASHIIFGIGQTLSIALNVIFIVLKKLADLKNVKVMEIFSKEGLNFCTGQWIDICWRNNLLCPSEEEYYTMSGRKSGGLYILLVKIMQCYSKYDYNFEPLLKDLGVYYQLRNDFSNLWDQDCHDKKGYCDDLTEGKFSFPIIHGIRSRPDDIRIIDILKQRPTDIETKSTCVSLLKQFGSLDYTKHMLEKYDEKVRKEIKRLGGNPYLEKILDNWKEIIIRYNSNEATKPII